MLRQKNKKTEKTTMAIIQKTENHSVTDMYWKIIGSKDSIFVFCKKKQTEISLKTVNQHP